MPFSLVSLYYPSSPILLPSVHPSPCPCPGPGLINRFSLANIDPFLKAWPSIKLRLLFHVLRGRDGKQGKAGQGGVVGMGVGVFYFVLMFSDMQRSRVMDFIAPCLQYYYYYYLWRGIGQRIVREPGSLFWVAQDLILLGLSLSDIDIFVPQ